MPKEQSYAIYTARTQLTPLHVKVSRPGEPDLYVRAELNDCDYNEAMNRAFRASADENFANTIPA